LEHRHGVWVTVCLHHLLRRFMASIYTPEKWRKFYRAWSSYSIVTELNKKSEALQVAILLTVIGEEA